MLAQPNPIKELNQFSLSLYQLQPKGSNIVISPLSVAYLLAILHGGAQGDTKKQIETLLNRNTLDKMDNIITKSLPQKYFNNYCFDHFYCFISNFLNRNQSKFLLNNAIWYDKTIKISPQFKTNAKKLFKIHFSEVDFKTSNQALSAINKWVKKYSLGKNKLFLDKIEADTALIAINLIYFKANWQSQFKKSDTTINDFYIASGQTVAARMMQQTHDYDYYNDNGTQIVILSYEKIPYEMLIIMPSPEEKLENWLNGFTQDKLNTLIKNASQTEISLKMPKFESQAQLFDVKSSLTSLGVSDLFDPNKADLSNLTQSRTNLYVSKLLQSSYIKVDESGSEAAVASAAVVLFGNPPPLLVNINRPFLFMIMHKEMHLILFIGHITNPNINAPH
ncbi:serpin family protein [Legionella israelensis]|uniref:serpin family protein n=1 Tax=Legionella israelensis TaxID=454 RepID=UPI00142FE66E|nr:serpin family protein [Legionella israelensis]